MEKLGSRVHATSLCCQHDILDHLVFQKSFKTRSWDLLLASEGDEFGQRIGERLENCKCNLYGEHHMGFNKYYCYLFALSRSYCIFFNGFTEWKKALDIIYEWGFKGSDREFLFKKETSTNGILLSFFVLKPATIFKCLYVVSLLFWWSYSVVFCNWFIVTHELF